MTDTPINLNRIRKARVRAAKKARADENAARFGRSRAQKARDAAETEMLRARLDAAKRETDPPET